MIKYLLVQKNQGNLSNDADSMIQELCDLKNTSNLNFDEAVQQDLQKFTN